MLTCLKRLIGSPTHYSLLAFCYTSNQTSSYSNILLIYLLQGADGKKAAINFQKGGEGLCSERALFVIRKYQKATKKRGPSFSFSFFPTAESLVIVSHNERQQREIPSPTMGLFRLYDLSCNLSINSSVMISYSVKGL